ncbi:hypothetical protein CRYUN_Cryun05aG0073500 [Craigia yunnanensis]
MAEGMTTRGVLLQKELELLRSEMTAATEQLRKEIETRLGSTGMETRKMFEKIMLKFDSSRGLGFEASGSTQSTDLKQKGIVGVHGEDRVLLSSIVENIDLTGGPKILTKYSRLELPQFEGVDFRGWILKEEQFFKADQTREQDKVRNVMMHLDGRAFQWHQRFVKNQGSFSEDEL